MIKPHDGRQDGVTQAFTLIFQHNCAFTFSYHKQRGKMTAEIKERLAEKI